MRLVKDLYFPDADRHMAAEYEAGRTQLDVLEAALRHVRDFTSAVDGGAHVGLFSRAMADRFGAVYAFEPAPDTREALVANMRAYPNVVVYPLALEERHGWFSMAEDGSHEANTGGRHLAPGGEVEAVPLDLVVAQPVGLIKLDVEGVELMALRGAAEILTKYRPVVIAECKPRLMSRAGVAPGAVTGFMEGLGARIVDRVRRDYVYSFV